MESFLTRFSRSALRADFENTSPDAISITATPDGQTQADILMVRASIWIRGDNGHGSIIDSNWHCWWGEAYQFAVCFTPDRRMLTGTSDILRTHGTPTEADYPNGTTNTPSKRRGIRKTTNENGARGAPLKRGWAGRQLLEHHQIVNATTETETPDNLRKGERPKEVSKKGEDPDTQRTCGRQPKNLLVGINSGIRKTGKTEKTEKAVRPGTRGEPKNKLAAIHLPYP